jgi:hypothetical protein
VGTGHGLAHRKPETTRECWDFGGFRAKAKEAAENPAASLFMQQRVHSELLTANC